MDIFKIGGKELNSRLFTGSGKYCDHSVIPKVLNESGAQVITLAVRRLNLNDPQDNIISHIPKDIILLPNTSGARNAEEAIRIARLARAMGCGDWVKIEVISDHKYLLPDNQETIKATEILSKEGFYVFPYMNPDLYDARALVNAGAAAVMPLGAPIGTNKGILTEEMIRILIEEIDVPVIVDAGLGKPSHAAKAMEMGAAAVLVNTAIATAGDPVLMGKAFKMATQAGRIAYLSKMAKTKHYASASSPLTGFLGGK
ncbi:MAG: thiazole synthase [Clostridia bacterium]|nr:thiazole synthase [Clostridia bacterium]